MGILKLEMKKGMRVFVDYWVETEDYKHKSISSVGYLEETPHIAAKYVKVKLLNGPNQKNEIAKVPSSCIFWIKQS